MHGEAGLALALKTTELFFGQTPLTAAHSFLVDVSSLLYGTHSQALQGAQGGKLQKDGLDKVTFAEVAVASGAATSKTEARTLIKGGGIYINGTRYEHRTALYDGTD